MNTKEAIERVRSRFNNWALDDEDLVAMKVLIPELTESEDENIIKWLIAVIEEVKTDDDWCADLNKCNEAITWLKKQKEQKITECTSDSVLQKIKIAITHCKELSEHYKDTKENFYQYYGGKAEGLQLALACFGNENELAKQKSTEWSNDERIKKWLYDYISNCPNNNFTFYGGVGKDAVLNYIEKQKEQKPIKQPKFKIGDVVKFKGFGDEPANDTPLKIVGYDNELYLFDNGTTDLFSEQDLYELVEQKPAEWSEKDEVAIKMAIIALEDIYDERSPDDSYIGYDLPFNEAAKRLKALSPQPNTVSIKDATKFGNLEYERGVKDGLNQHWKPSKEQMSMLLAVINEPNNAGSESCHISLKSLYNDLEKQM